MERTQREYVGADFNYRIVVEPFQEDNFRMVDKSLVSIYRYNEHVNKIIERFPLPNRIAPILLNAFDAAEYDDKAVD